MGLLLQKPNLCDSTTTPTTCYPRPILFFTVCCRFWPEHRQLAGLLGYSNDHWFAKHACKRFHPVKNTWLKIMDRALTSR
jgi:hypothetical protein